MANPIQQALSRIAEYSGRLETATALMGDVQVQLEKAGDVDVKKDLRSQQAKLSYLIGLYKEFLEFWKDVIKTALSLLKMFNELAQGAR